MWGACARRLTAGSHHFMPCATAHRSVTSAAMRRVHNPRPFLAALVQVKTGAWLQHHNEALQAYAEAMQASMKSENREVRAPSKFTNGQPLLSWPPRCAGRRGCPHT
jgi:hypothetical protein